MQPHRLASQVLPRLPITIRRPTRTVGVCSLHQRTRANAFLLMLIKVAQNVQYRLLLRNKYGYTLNKRQLRISIVTLLSIAIAIFYLFSHHDSRLCGTPSKDDPERAFKGGGGPRIAKACMLYGSQNPLYERAIRSHRVHNELHNYPMHVLRHEITGGYWNKPSYLLSLVVNELAKPPEERTEWIMWVDADLVILNPLVPLEIFLPPAWDFEHIHFVGNKDQNGLNTGTFFLHVHEWSVKFLAKSLALPMYRPEIDLGNSMDQVAMARVLNESDFSSATLFQPRIWYNTYEFHHGFEGRRGNLLVHFPGLQDDRWKHMSDWLDTVERDKEEWSVPLEQTIYPAQTKEYWETQREAKDLLSDGETWEAERRGSIPMATKLSMEGLRFALRYHGDQLAQLRLAMEDFIREVEKTLSPKQRPVEVSPLHKSSRL